MINISYSAKGSLNLAYLAEIDTHTRTTAMRYPFRNNLREEIKMKMKWWSLSNVKVEHVS